LLNIFLLNNPLSRNAYSFEAIVSENNFLALACEQTLLSKKSASMERHVSKNYLTFMRLSIVTPPPNLGEMWGHRFLIYLYLSIASPPKAG
jgi:hypothetical protein